jgi:hypothetical protein
MYFRGCRLEGRPDQQVRIVPATEPQSPISTSGITNGQSADLMTAEVGLGDVNVHCEFLFDVPALMRSITDSSPGGLVAGLYCTIWPVI